MSITRIYQGRVTNIEILDGKDAAGKPQWRALKDWPDALWQHHQLFQDAVNYYTLALAALAKEVQGDSAQSKALRDWVAKVRETWTTASRKSDVFDGPQSRLAIILKIDPKESDFEKAAACVIKSSCATTAQRTSALLQLLLDQGDLNQICVARLPWLASAAGKLAATSKAASSYQEVQRQRIVRQFHQWSEMEALTQAKSLDLGLFLAQPPNAYVKSTEAAKMLRDYFAKAKKKFPELLPMAGFFESFLTNTDTLTVPSPGRKPSGLYPIAAVFKYFPAKESLAAFRKATETLAKAKDKDVVTDAVAEARVADQPHFDYFTNLALVNNAEDQRDTRSVWFEFDLAAFVEAIKTPRRYFEDTQKREASATHLRKQIAAMEEKGYQLSSEDDESDPLPGFEGDVRIELLKSIVQKKLAWLAEAEDDAEATGPREYTIRERTVRSFGEIKRYWRMAHDAGHATGKQLLEILAKEQTEHRDDFGSAPFYSELSKTENHPVWRDGGTQPWHAEDPIAAWLQYKELQSDLADKERAIRFTPAHPIYSPRYFVFPKKSEAQPKTNPKHVSKHGLTSHHDPGQLSFTAGIILPVEQGRSPKVVRIHYAAPRICRDQIRSIGDSNLYEAPWLQPMMAALDLDNISESVNFANCRISLQPKNESNIQLTFPVEVNNDKIKAGVARETVWNKQFNMHPEGGTFYNASLRWLHEKQPAKAPLPWHEQVDSFRCLATDLGQRDAGAFARLLVHSDSNFGTRPSRAIGTTGNKQWHAALERSGLFRLPGEDAQVWRARTVKDNDNQSGFAFREELWGEHGRQARNWEADDTAELMTQLELPPEDQQHSLLPTGWRDSLSFPEQNAKLLVAIRRYQSRIARLHRWCWFLNGDDKQQKTAWDEICECDDVRIGTPELKSMAEKRDPRARQYIECQLLSYLSSTPMLLVRIANRVMPLRGRSWKWEPHPAATKENELHYLTQNGPCLDSAERPVWLRGQRGLSVERIEQIDELRKRCQSLNQMLRRKVGDKPPARRDESVPDPCPDLLDKLDHLKEQRINQTAHMILAEALGLRLAPPSADKKMLRQQRDQHGVYEKIIDKNGAWIGPVDFIVIEDLSRYRASQGRAPRENSRLMKWCHRAVRDKLKLLCEVFGLAVLETPAAYSSRFCSRSGVPGFRAAEVTVGFTKQGHWQWLVKKNNDDAQRLSTLDRELTEAQKELERDWAENKRPGPCPKRTLLVPIAGGPIFVPVVDTVQDTELKPAVVQADVNAAINLALRAIADPRLWTIHPRVRSARGGDKPAKGKKSKAAQDGASATPQTPYKTREKRKFGAEGLPLSIIRPAEAKQDDTRQPNFFADLADLKAHALHLAETNQREHGWLTKEWTSAEISGTGVTPALIHGKSFWGVVKAMQWQRIQEINNERLAAWRKKMNQLSM